MVHVWTKENSRNGGKKAGEVTTRRVSFREACMPRHVRQTEQFTREWFTKCDAAFQLAMRENPGERPSGSAGYNGAGSGR